MATATLEYCTDSLADMLHRLGDIPLERIRFPAGRATEADVIKYMEAADKRLYELIDGVLVEKAMGFWESSIASIIVQHFWNFLDDYDLGIAFSAHGPFRVRVGRIRFPDTGFISCDRLPCDDVPRAPILAAVPNLAAEVISKSNTVREMENKLLDYFGAGVQLVWYIYPETQTAVVYTSPTRKKTIGPDGTLDGGKVLPGFNLPLKKLFARTRRRGTGRQRGNGAR